MEIVTTMTENDLLAALRNAMTGTDGEPENQPTTEWLANEMGVSTRKVRKTLRQLINDGIVAPYQIRITGINGVASLSYAYRVKEQPSE